MGETELVPRRNRFGRRNEVATAARSDDRGPLWQSWLSQGLAERLVRLPAEAGDEEGVSIDMDESEQWHVPSSLSKRVAPILRAAKEIEKTNPRVAFICLFAAFEVAHKEDPLSRGREVRQFKTRLIHRLEKDEQETKRRLATTDAREIGKFFEQYYKKNLEGDLDKKSREEMARIYETVSVLYDALRLMTPGKYPNEYDKYAIGVEKEKASFSNYNILPLHMSDPTHPLLEIPEIKAALELLRTVDNLPKPRTDSISASEVMDEPVFNDLFDWLWQTFGFQKDNVENQKEHLILLLANIDMRKGGSGHQIETQNRSIHSDTITYLTRKIFQNYISWCQYLHLESNIKIPHTTSTQQPELLYIGLYLLIWGEASDVRLMPECLCYIFHHMAETLYDIISSSRREDFFVAPFGPEGSHAAFLHRIIEPIYTVMEEDAALSKRSMMNSRWRNYNDLNEYFWSRKCLKQLKWPTNQSAKLLWAREGVTQSHLEVAGRRRIPKTNFVELPKFFHLLRSFDRLWTFFTLAFQAMVIIAWSHSGSLSAIFQPTVFRYVTTIFITDAFLHFLQATLDIVLNWNAWRSLECSQMLRYILKFATSLAWLIILPTAYISSVHNLTGLNKFFSKIVNLQRKSLYDSVVALYMLPYIFKAMIFVFLPLQRALERSNSHIVRFFVWWAQPKLYVGRGMYDDASSLLKYTLFWVLLLTCKLAFSFFVEIFPLVGPTREIVLLGLGTNELRHKLCVIIITVWVPTIMVYFMDTQIWYAIISTFFGGVIGACRGLGEIRNLGMLTSRFQAIPRAFRKKLVPGLDSRPNRTTEHEDGKSFHIEEFSDIWNAFIISMRDEDLISNRERDLLIVPSSLSMNETTVFQWPPFLVASKIPLAVEMANFVKNDELLKRRIYQDPYTLYAVIECYETLLYILYSLTVDEPKDKKVVDQIKDDIEASLRRQSLVNDFWLAGLAELSAKFDMLLGLLLKHYHQDRKIQIVTLLQDIMEIITRDIMKNGQGILEEGTFIQCFANINLDSVKVKPWREKCTRLRLLLSTKGSTKYLLTNNEARRRIIFFSNSLFMNMPRAPQIRNMMSFSILTPYFKEEVLFSAKDLYERMKDRISLLSYLQKSYPDEWKNFLERIDLNPIDEESLELNTDEICKWASYRGQTLTRTVRGMMYYRRALEIQCIQDKSDLDRLDRDKIVESSQEARAIADIKFTYIASCEAYGKQKNSLDIKDKAAYMNIRNLMMTYPSLRVAYIDEIEAPTGNETTEKTYYSVLVKGVGYISDEEIYRIKLPGKPTDTGEGKPVSKNNAIIFTRGEALQAIDTNQDNYLEEAFKMRNLLEEFENGKNKPTILGIRMHYFTESVSSLAWLMSNKEIHTVTIGQRFLANTLKVRFHCGQSDIFDRLFHITRGGISEGFNSTMREGNITYYEYMQVGKGLDMEMNQISRLEANMACSNGEQTLSRDIYRLGQGFDFCRMLSLYFTTVGFYFSSLVSVLTVYVFLYGRLYLIVNRLERSFSVYQQTQENMKPLERTLGAPFVFQLGYVLCFQMLMEVGLEKGFHTAFGELVIMQLQLASVFFTFQFGTKAHYYGRTVLHGVAKLRPTGSDGLFPVYHTKFAENYRMYSRSHFVKALELLMLLVVYLAYGCCYRRSSLNLFLNFSIWFMVVSWLFAPFIFNPSCFEWHKIVDDWKDWRNWMENPGGLGILVEQSWEAWWESEQEHLRKTGIHGLLLEIILSLRFLIYQFGIVYYLNIAYPTGSILVQALSWLVMLSALVVLKVDSLGGQKFGTDMRLMFQILKALVILGTVLIMAVLFVVSKMAISDAFVSVAGLIPTVWCVLLIGQACSPLLKKTFLWDPFIEIWRAYDSMMGLVIFLPIIFLSWLPGVSKYHTHLLFNKLKSEEAQISRILPGQETRDFE